jgi:hypothetical protein
MGVETGAYHGTCRGAGDATRVVGVSSTGGFGGRGVQIQVGAIRSHLHHTRERDAKVGAVGAGGGGEAATAAAAPAQLLTPAREHAGVNEVLRAASDVLRGSPTGPTPLPWPCRATHSHPPTHPPTHTFREVQPFPAASSSRSTMLVLLLESAPPPHWHEFAQLQPPPPPMLWLYP